MRAAHMLARGCLSHYDQVTGERADWTEAQYGIPLGGEVIYRTSGSAERVADLAPQQGQPHNDDLSHEH